MSYLSVVNFEQDHFKSRADESGRWEEDGEAHGRVVRCALLRPYGN